MNLKLRTVLTFKKFTRENNNKINIFYCKGFKINLTFVIFYNLETNCDIDILINNY